METPSEIKLVQAESPEEILKQALKQFEGAVPPAFNLSLEKVTLGEQGKFLAGALIDVVRDKQNLFKFAAEIKTTVDNSNLLKTIEIAQKQLKPLGLPLVVARYISLPAQEELKKLAISFADATGNVFVSVPDQGLLLNVKGLNRDPWRKAGRPKSVLTGVSTELVIRALIENREPYKMVDVIEKSGASRGSAYWIMDSLEEAGYVSRNQKGFVEFVKWKELLEAWTVESNFYKTNKVSSYIAPRGLDKLVDDLRKTDKQLYAASGTIATGAYKSSAGLYTAILYSTNLSELASSLGLRETEVGANVILADPNSDGPYLGAQEFDGLKVVSAAQACRDLMWGPGRNPEEAKVLLEWMVTNVEFWRK